MNLRDKLRAVNGKAAPAEKKERERPAETEKRDCRHLAVYRPMAEFPGATEVRRETLEKMSGVPLPEVFDPRRILYLDTETTGLAGSGTKAEADYITASVDDEGVRKALQHFGLI